MHKIVERLSTEVNVPLSQALTSALDEDALDDTQILERVVELRRLVDRVEAELEQHSNHDPALYSDCVAKLRAVLRINKLSAKWTGPTEIPAAVLTALRFAESDLDRATPERNADDNHLQRLADHLRQLDEAITNADLPSELRSVLTRQLEGITRALRHYRIKGLEGLEEALALAAGDVALHQEVIAAHSDHPAVQSWRGVIEDLHAIVSLAHLTHQTAFPAVENIVGLLQ